MALPGDDQHRHLWQTFLQSDAGHAGLEKQHQEETDLHRADYKARIKPIQLRELADALEGCSRDVKRAVAPLLEYECVHHILYGVLVSCHVKKIDFSDHLQSHSIRKQLEQLAEDVRINAQNGVDVDGEYWAGVTRKLNATEHATRFVDLQTFCDALNQGNATLAVARQKWDDGLYEAALERYEGGASALEFLRVRNPDDAAKLSELQTRFFRNAAACALKLDKWCLAQKLCRKALAIDPSDIRARYKLGVAYARRGDAVRADECFAAIVAAGDEGAQAAARERVKLRERAAPTFEHGFLGRGAFSEGRASSNDEGLRRKLAARLCVDGDGPALGRDAVVEAAADGLVTEGGAGAAEARRREGAVADAGAVLVALDGRRAKRHHEVALHVRVQPPPAEGLQRDRARGEDDRGPPARGPRAAPPRGGAGAPRGGRGRARAPRGRGGRASACRG